MPTKIEWVVNPDGTKGTTWNPVTGCDPVSAGCDNCYARRMANRLRGRYGYPQDDPFKVTLHADRLDQPLHWRKPRMIFVCSMGDLFHKDVPDDFVTEVFKYVILSHKHTFIVLTKRPKRMAEYLLNMPEQGKSGCLPQNLWLGVSVEDQKTADERIPILLQVPAAVRVVSIEPMLGSVNLHSQQDWLPTLIPNTKTKLFSYRNNLIPTIDWIICGGETGPGARPMHPEWARDIIRQCNDANVPVFIKQVAVKGKMNRNILEWPEELRVRQFPNVDDI